MVYQQSDWCIMFDLLPPVLPIKDRCEFVYTPIQVHQQGFALMEQVQGWCSQSKAMFLMDLVLRSRPQTVLEIGVFGGKSLLPIAAALKSNASGVVYGIDPWSITASLEDVASDAHISWWDHIDYDGLMGSLIAKIDQFGLKEHVQLIKSTSKAAPLIGQIDLLHIDGNHSEITSYLDVIKWVPHVKKGGWVIFDDLTWEDNGVRTTQRAINWLDEHCFKIAEFKDDCVWGVWVVLR